QKKTPRKSIRSSRTSPAAAAPQYSAKRLADASADLPQTQCGRRLIGRPVIDSLPWQTCLPKRQPLSDANTDLATQFARLPLCFQALSASIGQDGRSAEA